MAALNRIDIDQFLTMANSRLTGASHSGLKAELFDVLKEFFKDTNSWTEDIVVTPVAPPSGAQSMDYNIQPVDGGQIIRLIGVWDQVGIPVPAYMKEFGTLRVPNPVNPPTGASWTARVVKNVMLPTDRNDTPICPDWTLAVYEDVILDGLCGRMMGQMNKSYSDPNRSVYHLRRFRTGITNARTAAVRQNTVGAQEWAYPRGWHSSSQRGGVSTAWPTRAF